MQTELINILRTRDGYRMLSDEWCKYDNMKIKFLESSKPATKESCFFYYSKDIKDMPTGFISGNQLPKARLYVGTRSVLEYSGGLTRHIIPYSIITHDDEYFLATRVGGTETRLTGKVSLIGGHVGREGIDAGMVRELKEEIDLTDGKIKLLKMKGFIKSDGDIRNPLDVSRDHLGIVYKITLKRKNIREYEAGTLKGFWVHKDTIRDYYDRAEDWLKLLIDAGVFT